MQQAAKGDQPESRIADEEALQHLLAAPPAADMLRQRGFTDAANLASTAAAAAERELVRRRAQEKADSPAVEAAAARLRQTRRMGEAISAEAAAATVQVPARTEAGFIIFGLVAAPNGQGIAGMTVAALEPDSGRALRHACSDASGAYRIEIEGQGETRSVCLQVSDAGTRIVAAPPNPVAVRPGGVVRRDIILNGSEPPCSPPPEEKPNPNPKQRKPTAPKRGKAA